ncbi:N-acetylmuramoyl-L-alanine amidase [Symbioplanes lichenis]|uniref:N-acetylmuramoyl-L-alanine amidase n=1 Tax=Symbioplanes lichenis TaxID=1629072 RepID=UPI00273A5402|nr:N-acetylmuramoyl-L-alanine amidase [Actinoplanes lichenis]
MKSAHKRVLSTSLGTAMLLGAMVVATASGGASAAPSDEATLQTVPLGVGRQAFSAGRATGSFSLVGATWADARERLTGKVQVRTRSADGRWTGWQSLEADNPAPAAPGSQDAAAARGSTDPLWVGPSDGVEARVTGGGPVPAGLRLDLIDPGAGSAAPALERKAVTEPARPIPPVVTRAQWGANEKLVKGAPEYTTDVEVLFVHHTAGTNGYSCADSPAIIRSIQAYHVKSNHWNDIGYNFLVDKCGTLFEGRRGGITRPVLGAHTLGFNAHSAAVAVLGNYSSAAVTAKVRTVIAQLAAYKIAGYGHAPGGRAALVSSGSDRYAKGSTAILNRISGHRDTGMTECPGNVLYRQLGAIRSLASAAPSAPAITKINGAVQSDGTWFTRGTIRPYWTPGTVYRLMNRYDVYVDGVLTASVPRDQRQQLLTLTPGRHTIRVRALALNGQVSYTDTAVYADATLPAFPTGPSLSLRTGSLNNIVPVRLRWAASDAGGLRDVTLTSPLTRDLGPRATTWAGTATFNTATVYALRATDRAGNARSVATTRTAVLLSDGSATRTGAWRTATGTAYLGGQASRATTAGASLSWTFTGRSAALAVTRTAVSGEAQIYVDGDPAGVIDLRATETLYRRAVWTRSWTSTTEHTVKLVVRGTKGRPGVISDGLVYLK